MALDAHFTANAMANDNFVSSSNMKSPQAKRLHTEMAMQESNIANQYEMLAEQLGWVNPPVATNVEQTQVISPKISMSPNGTMTNQQQIEQRYTQ